MVNHSQHTHYKTPWHQNSHIWWHSHIPLAPYKLPTQPLEITHPPMVQKQFTNTRQTNICLMVNYSTYTLQDPPVLVQPPLAALPHPPGTIQITDTATSNFSSNTPVIYILATTCTLSISPGHQHPLIPITNTATASNLPSFPDHHLIASTATGVSSSHMLGTHAPTTFPALLGPSISANIALPMQCLPIMWLHPMQPSPTTQMLDAACYLHSWSFFLHFPYFLTFHATKVQ